MIKYLTPSAYKFREGSMEAPRNKIKRHLMAALLFVFLLSLSNPLEILGEDRIILSLESFRSKILAYEPLELKFILRNISNETIETTLALGFLGEYTRLQFSFEYGEPPEAEWIKMWMPSMSFIPPVRERFKPMESISYLLECYWQKDCPIFDKPGTYTLAASWRGSSGPAETWGEGNDINVTSAPVKMLIVKGFENDNQCLKELLSRDIHGFLNLESEYILPEKQSERIVIFEGLYDVAKAYPDSTYSPYCLSALLSLLESNCIKDDKFEKKVLKLTKKRIHDRPHPRILYFYAKIIGRENREIALQYLNQAKSIEPGPVILEMIQKAEAEMSFIEKEWEDDNPISHSLAFSPDGRTLAAASEDRRVTLWDVFSGKEIRRLMGHQQFVGSVAFSFDGRTVYSAGGDNTLRGWDVSSGKEVLRHRAPNLFENSTFSRDGRLYGSLYTLKGDGYFGVWETRTGKQLFKKNTGDYLTNLITFSPDGKVLASADSDKYIRFWGVSAGKEIQKLKVDLEIIYPLIYSFDGKKLAFLGEDKVIRVWDIKESKETNRIFYPQMPKNIYAMAFSPDATWLALGGEGEKILIFDVAKAHKVHELSTPQGIVYCLAFSPDGEKMASGGADTMVVLWDLSGGIGKETSTYLEPPTEDP